jgi:hypothetical protein
MMKYQYNKELLTLLYWTQKLSIGHIAQEMRSDRATIHRAMVRYGVPRRPLSEANGPPKLGELNPRWQGNNITPKSGRCRARRMYREQQLCHVCGKPAERHHKDGDPLNNDPRNIDWRCRKHHMEADGRLLRRQENGRFGL